MAGLFRNDTHLRRNAPSYSTNRRGGPPFGRERVEAPRLLAQRSDPKMAILAISVLKVLALIRTH
jgi:hypothetical protein